MAVKIRLRMQGKRGRPFFRIVVADSRSPRDGKYIEKLGWYNPFDEEKQLEINGERLSHWLSEGASLTLKAASLAKKAQPEILKKFLEKKPKKKKEAKGQTETTEANSAESALKKGAAPKKATPKVKKEVANKE